MDAVEFLIGPSRSLIVFLWILCLSTLGMLGFLQLPWVIKILLMLLAILFVWMPLKAARGPRSLARIWQDSQGRWGGETPKGTLHRLQVLNASYCSPLLIIVHFRSENGRWAILIPFDSLSKREYRTLCARLHGL